MPGELKRFLWALLITLVLAYTVLEPQQVPAMERLLVRFDLPLWLHKLLSVLAWFSLAWTTAAGFELFVWRRLYGQSLSGVPRQRKLLTDLFNVVLYVIAAGLIAFEVFDKDPTALFATSGVIAIILGFAIQQLLSDIFAGIALNLERPFKAGDWITLDGTQGVVLMTNWRSTHLRTRQLDLMVVPNAVVGRAKLINHSLPQPRHLDSVEVPLQYGCDEAEVKRLLLAAALTVDGVLADPAPLILLHEMRSSVMIWRIYFFTDNFAALVVMKAGLLNAAYAALRGSALALYLARDESIVHRDTPGAANPRA